MSLDTRIRDLTIRMATECKSIRMLLNGNAADLSGLTTATKTSLVDALNVLQGRLDVLAATAVINDATPSTFTTWSAQKIMAELAVVKNDITSGASSTMDAIAAINAALHNDENVAATLTAAIGTRVRFDAAQTLTPSQQVVALANIGAAPASALGSTDTDFVAVFNSSLTQ